MIAFCVSGLLLAAALHIGAHLNRPTNVAAGFRLGERSTLIGSGLILAGYGLWLWLVTVIWPAGVSPAGAFAALAGHYAAAWVGAKTAWLYLDARDGAQTAAQAALPRRWKGGPVVMAEPTPIPRAGRMLVAVWEALEYLDAALTAREEDMHILGNKRITRGNPGMMALIGDELEFLQEARGRCAAAHALARQAGPGLINRLFVCPDAGEVCS